MGAVYLDGSVPAYYVKREADATKWVVWQKGATADARARCTTTSKPGRPLLQGAGGATPTTNVSHAPRESWGARTPIPLPWSFPKRMPCLAPRLSNLVTMVPRTHPSTRTRRYSFPTVMGRVRCQTLMSPSSSETPPCFTAGHASSGRLLHAWPPMSLQGRRRWSLAVDPREASRRTCAWTHRALCVGAPCLSRPLRPCRHADKWAAALPHARVVALPDSGFFLDYVAPDGKVNFQASMDWVVRVRALVATSVLGVEPETRHNDPPHGFTAYKRIGCPAGCLRRRSAAQRQHIAVLLR